jgi:hypothetical protein
MPYPTMDFTPSIPSQDSSSRPFEIMMYPSALNELFKEFKRELGIGVKDISVCFCISYLSTKLHSN